MRICESLRLHLRPYLYIQETLMAADDLPAPPQAGSGGSGAIQRAILEQEKKAGESAHHPANGESTSTGSSARSSGRQGKSLDTARESPGPAFSDSDHVEIPLNTPPPANEEADPMAAVKDTFEEISVTEHSDGDSDGHRTPRQGNGRSTPANSSSSESPSSLPQAARAARRMTSSAAAWTNIIAAAVDHSDEHVTKSVQFPASPNV